MGNRYCKCFDQDTSQSGGSATGTEMPDKLGRLWELSCCPQDFSLPTKPKVIVAFGSRAQEGQGNEVSKRLRYIAQHYYEDQRPGILLTGNKDEAAHMKKELEDIEECDFHVDEEAKNTHDNARWIANKLEELGEDLSVPVAFIAFPVLAAGGMAALRYQGFTNLHPVFPAICEHINVQDPTLKDGWINAKLAEKQRNGWAGALNFSKVAEDVAELKWVFGAEAPGERQLGSGKMVPDSAVKRWGEWMLKQHIVRTLCLLKEEELNLYETPYMNSLREVGLKPEVVNVCDEKKAWDKIKTAIDNAVKNGENIVVHCNDGHIRTGCVLGAILKHYMPTLSYEDAEKKLLLTAIRKPKASGIQMLIEQGTLKHEVIEN
eukprot:TRINITY_DN19860_c0_g1_i1.p1 TRINITY_DN19860_c0_g1~~TRINITY_DN19860_c0_g1_i1.p1  ORF type:complete len:376 (+),score=81.08 TRINITY_DN19860_c0_g1_i1:75-1202(+)